jgi:hypothetical protein
MTLSLIKKVIRPSYYKLYDLFDFRGQGLLAKNKDLKDLHKNKRCFIIATGTSLLEIDLSKLKNEYTFGFNFIFIHEEMKKSNLNYYLISDTYKNVSNNMYFPKALNAKKRSDQPYKMFSEMFKMADETTLITNRDNSSAINKYFNSHIERPYYFKADINLKDTGNQTDVDLLKRFSTYPGSIFMAIQMAVYMGFKEIYLAGAGYTYSPTNEYHFYDGFETDTSNDYLQAEEMARSFIAERMKNSPSKKLQYRRLVEYNGKYRGIFSQTKKLDNEHYVAHAMIKKIAESHGAKIINIVPEGFNSPVYENISWNQVERNITI